MVSHPSARELPATLLFLDRLRDERRRQGSGNGAIAARAPQHRACEAADAGRRAEQSRVSGDPAQCSGVVVVHFADEQPSPPRIFIQGPGRRRACPQGVRHSERQDKIVTGQRAGREGCGSPVAIASNCDARVARPRSSAMKPSRMKPRSL